VDKRDYYFLSKEDFLKRVEMGDFIEHAEVHGNHYGTLRSEVVGRLNSGVDVVMDIDVQGAAQVRACEDPVVQRSLVDLFVMPPSEKELAARLTGRGTDSEEVIALRLKNAIEEMSHWPKYSYRLLSATREEDYTNFKALMIGERMRVSRIKTT
jgi:guanylate kinase